MFDLVFRFDPAKPDTERTTQLGRVSRAFL